MIRDDCDFLAKLCAARAGLEVDPDQLHLIESRLGPVARREGFTSVTELLTALREPGLIGQDELLAAAVVEAMAAGDTSFFRNRQIFERLWRDVIPELARRRPDGVVRIWSAGCAAGQEIYSFAILQAETPAPTGRVELFASDFSERLLDRARSGLYSSFEVQRGLSARQLVRHFENRDDGFQLARRIRQEVRWRRVNLIEDLAPLGVFDIVLCRNVLSGLTAPARARVLESLAGVVAPDGVLVLGEGEAADCASYVPFPTFGGVFVRARELRAAA
jgi:chemotaxis protein methyltransferase CheR